MRRLLGAALFVAVVTACVLIVTLGTLSWLGWMTEHFLIPAVFWSSVFFILYYSTLAAWWLNPMGRMLVGLDLSIAALTFPSTLQFQFGIDLAVRTQVQIVVGSLLLAFVVVVSRTVLLGYLHSWVPRKLPRRRVRRPEPDEQ